MENILKKRLGVFVVLFVISFYFVGLYINENLKRIIKCPLITNSDGKVIYLPSYYGHTEDWFYFNWDTSMGFVWITYKTKSGSYWHQHPELKLYGCHRISKSELPK